MRERSVEHATFVAERTYHASPDRVFAAWSDPEAKARWFDGSEGDVEFDFRVGGRERRRGTLPDGRAYTFHALYQDIVWARRIVFTYDMLVEETRISVSVATVQFRPSAPAPDSSSPSRAPSSTATRRRDGANRAWAACWTRWQPSCGVNVPAPE
jgi:uncharacterized protein YndB with AHSA1/START domain